MDSSLILSVVTFVYGAAAILYIAAWIFLKDGLAKAGTWVSIMGLFANTAGIILRWVESYQMNIGHAPLSNMYESMIFFGWMIMGLYLVLEWRYKNRVIGAFALPVVFLVMAYAALSPETIRPLVPALKSNWLIAHVSTCFIGYAAFALAFGISIMYVLKSSYRDSGKPFIEKLPDFDILEELNHQMVLFGFLFLSVGIITGSVWANSAWGSYWSWDPKETWSLITWLIYAFLLHVRLMRGWQGKSVAWISIAGFGAVLFTFFGVNYLLSGLHAYG